MQHSNRNLISNANIKTPCNGRYYLMIEHELSDKSASAPILVPKHFISINSGLRFDLSLSSIASPLFSNRRIAQPYECEYLSRHKKDRPLQTFSHQYGFI